MKKRNNVLLSESITRVLGIFLMVASVLFGAAVLPGFFSWGVFQGLFALTIVIGIFGTGLYSVFTGDDRLLLVAFINS